MEPEIQDYLVQALQDANSEVRRKARVIFIKFTKIWPKEASRVMYSVECSY